jgi:ABC-type multidrug transport system fused ATPase/permease subunit
MLASVRRVLSFLSTRERTVFFTLLSLRALSGLLDIAGIALIGLVTSIAAVRLTTKAGAPAPTLLGFRIPNVTDTELLWLVVLVLAVFVVKALIAIALTRGIAYYVAAIEARNAYDLAEYLLRESLDSIKRFSKAEIQYALTGSTTYAFTGLLNNVATIASEGFLLVVIAATFFVVNPVIAIFALVYFGLVVLIIQVFIARSLRKAGRDAVSGTVDTINALSDTLDTFREIAVLQKQGLFIERIRRARSSLASSDATRTFIAGMPRYVIETSLMLGVVAIVGYEFLTNQLGTGLVVVGIFLTGGVRMMASLLPLQSAFANIKQNAEQAQSALDLLREARARRAELAAEELDAGARPAIDVVAALPLVVTAATYRYPGDSHDTLHSLSFTVKPGSYVALIGPSGAGKTTTVDLILGLASPNSGEVRIGGYEPNALRAAAPGAVSYVPQKPGLISGTIAENIALGLAADDIDFRRVDEVIDAAFLREFVDSLPDGVNTSVGKQVDALSGGQIQRIGIARALYPRPRLIVLDEATSGLDASSEAFISASLMKLQGQVTVMVIAHRLSTVQHAEVVFVIENGHITASGDFKNVRKTVPMVAEYVKLMSFEDEG